MNKLNTKELNDVFTDVRKAYRLLYHYQRRVMDLAKFIGDKLEYKYVGGWSYYCKPSPNNGKGRLENWSWDWLNMYYYEFHFGFKESVGFSIFLQSDTGFFDSKTDNKLDVEEYKDVEESKTRLIFVCGKQGNWNPPLIMKNENISSNQEIFEGTNDEGSFMIGKTYDLSLFIDEESTIKQIEDFKEFCKKRKIEL